MVQNTFDSFSVIILFSFYDKTYRIIKRGTKSSDNVKKFRPTFENENGLRPTFFWPKTGFFEKL